ncbi:hypothetical protein N657DRAFT_642388 [Parathielavia appendiculata]|uniref:Uncharacterized protein n=1 Tax=Parathielavia appendiculata TaxID=2587402 RepID=A0AAN6Z558_9PEZI|nr:hypothetical protein N657DRAFT_642388 [Parathielavia appendiculata]
MQLSLLSDNLLFLGMLVVICSAAPAAENDAPALTLPGRLPSTCIDYSKTTSCFTATTTTTVTPRDCPKIKCQVPTDPIACPAYIKITTTAVPCSTDCCPRTPTKTVTKKQCPTCTTGCVIPTETYTVTTGCKTTPGGILTPTATLIIG